MLLTAARALLVAPLCFLFVMRSSVVGAIVLGIFVILDLVDGVLARRSRYGDSRLRRAADSCIDRFGVAIVMICAGISQPYFGFLGVALLMATFIAAPAAVQSYMAHRLVLKAPTWHKSWSSLLAVAGTLYLFGVDTLAHYTAAVAIALAVACSLQLRKLHLQKH